MICDPKKKKVFFCLLQIFRHYFSCKFNQEFYPLQFPGCSSLLNICTLFPDFSVKQHSCPPQAITAVFDHIRSTIQSCWKSCGITAGLPFCQRDVLTRKTLTTEECRQWLPFVTAEPWRQYFSFHYTFQSSETIIPWEPLKRWRMEFSSMICYER